ncbi:MAG: tRNA (adenosine(37)-N6)-dimethylallyltransferase MiaA [Bacteroidetes bacterium]|nr:tRNA (adenosine(37)-N6)-dimethylallyltransferase MiaA [Bacteroidota bacterium]
MPIRPDKQLIIIAGPTAVGKTVFAINLAKELKTEIISADSRQFYRELTIGTAKPSPEHLKQVNHHFINNLSIHDYYNVARYETEVLDTLGKLFRVNDKVVMVGGSGLYINAICNGIDELPDADIELRLRLQNKLQKEGVEVIRSELMKLDPEFYAIVDTYNPNRMLRALEVCLSTGRKYSDLRKNPNKVRDFTILKIGLNIERKQLYSIINNRVDLMLEQGLVEEVKLNLKYRNLNALNTVGYKEIIKYLDGEISLEQSVTDLKTNTRRYAKRQLTWFRKGEQYQWFHPDELEAVIQIL